MSKLAEMFLCVIFSSKENTLLTFIDVIPNEIHSLTVGFAISDKWIIFAYQPGRSIELVIYNVWTNIEIDDGQQKKCDPWEYHRYIRATNE